METQAVTKSARAKILALREEYGTPMAKLASMIGLPNRNYVYAYLNPVAFRNHRLNDAHLTAIARHFRVPKRDVVAEYHSALNQSDDALQETA